jgi:hypothetical protein
VAHSRLELRLSQAAAVALAMLISGCGATGFGAKGGKAKDKTDGSVNGNGQEHGAPAPAEGDAFGSGAPDDESYVPADDPVMVSGAALTCAEAPPRGAAAAGTTPLLCAVWSDHRRLDLAGYETQWHVFNDQAMRQEMAVRTQAAGLGLVQVTVPASVLNAGVVELWLRQASVWPESSWLRLRARLPLKTGAVQTLLGLDYDFWLGNNDYSGSSCKAKLVKNSMIQPDVGGVVELPFIVEKDATKLQIALTGICGVDKTTFNSVAVVDATGAEVIAPRFLAPDRGSLVLPQATLAAGRYLLVLRGHPAGSPAQADDFVIDAVELTTAPSTPVAVDLQGLVSRP